MRSRPVRTVSQRNPVSKNIHTYIHTYEAKHGQVFNSSDPERDAGESLKLNPTLVYRTSSRIGRATQRNPVSKKKK